MRSHVYREYPCTTSWISVYLCSNFSFDLLPDTWLTHPNVQFVEANVHASVVRACMFSDHDADHSQNQVIDVAGKLVILLIMPTIQSRNQRASRLLLVISCAGCYTKIHPSSCRINRRSIAANLAQNFTRASICKIRNLKPRPVSL